MEYKVRLTTEQLYSLANLWAITSEGAADILIDTPHSGAIYVGQGDDRALITLDGRVNENV